MLDTSTAVRRTAMDLLARREHSIQELQRKLRQRGADMQLVEVELQKLLDEGLLCEQRYLESYINSRAHSGRGPLRIREELNARGLSREDISKALAEADIDWSAQLQQLWERRFGQLPLERREYAKQVRFLLYRGYPSDMVQNLLRNAAVDV